MSTDLSIILTTEGKIAYRPLNTVGNYANGCRQGNSIKFTNQYSETVHFRFLDQDVKVKSGNHERASVGDASTGAHGLEADISSDNNPTGQIYVADPDDPGFISGTTTSNIVNGPQLTIALESGKSGLFFYPNQTLEVNHTQVVNAAVENSLLTLRNDTADTVYFYYHTTLLARVEGNSSTPISTPSRLTKGTHRIKVTDGENGEVELASGQLIILAIPPDDDDEEPGDRRRRVSV
ncbi:MAG: hypothetical protein QNK37_00375 [Acidobacteriota bacterium]|nr:hypothetical protein [Acidobacteriota bacterium]